MKLRTFLLCLAAAIALTLCASAADVVDSGTCGDNLTWTLDSDGILTISGAGEMDSYGYDESSNWRGMSPWYEKRDNIVTLIIPDSVPSIGDFAFSLCNRLKSVTIPNGVTNIGRCAFKECANLESVTIPDSVTSIGDTAFGWCHSLTSATIPEGVTVIDEDLFSQCYNLTSVTIPDGVTSIGNGAFNNCKSLTSVMIPDSVTSIGASAFGGCENLTSVTIPDNMTSISNYAFYYCQSLTDVYYDGSATQWSEIRISYGNDALKSATFRYNAQDVGVGITLTDESGEIVDGNGQTGEKEDEKKDAFQDGAEFTASFAAADRNAVTSSGLFTANVFVIFYDRDGLMLSLQQWEINLSDLLNIFFTQTVSVPEGAKTLKFLILGDSFEPLRAARLIEKSG